MTQENFRKLFPIFENPLSHAPKLQNLEKVWKEFPGYPLSHRPFFGNSFRDLSIWVKKFRILSNDLNLISGFRISHQKFGNQKFGCGGYIQNAIMLFVTFDVWQKRCQLRQRLLKLFLLFVFVFSPPEWIIKIKLVSFKLYSYGF